MAEIPTINMWNQQGKCVRVNEHDKALQGSLRSLGYEAESVIRSDLPEDMAGKPMEEIIAKLRGDEGPPKTEPEAPPEAKPEEEAAQKETAAGAAGKILRKGQGKAESEYYDPTTKTTRKKG
jgi:hypothetical protein